MYCNISFVIYINYIIINYYSGDMFKDENNYTIVIISIIQTIITGAQNHLIRQIQYPHFNH